MARRQRTFLRIRSRKSKGRPRSVCLRIDRPFQAPFRETGSEHALASAETVAIWFAVSLVHTRAGVELAGKREKGSERSPAKRFSAQVEKQMALRDSTSASMSAVQLPGPVSNQYEMAVSFRNVRSRHTSHVARRMMGRSRVPDFDPKSHSRRCRAKFPSAACGMYPRNQTPAPCIG